MYACMLFYSMVHSLFKFSSVSRLISPPFLPNCLDVSVCISLFPILFLSFWLCPSVQLHGLFPPHDDSINSLLTTIFLWLLNKIYYCFISFKPFFTSSTYSTLYSISRCTKSTKYFLLSLAKTKLFFLLLLLLLPSVIYSPFSFVLSTFSNDKVSISCHCHYISFW